MRSDISCDVKNVMYVIRCSDCNEYVVETGGLRKRVTVHYQQIRNITTRMLHIDEYSASVFSRRKQAMLHTENKKKHSLYEL